MILVVEDDLVEKITKAHKVCATEEEAINYVDEKNKEINNKKRYRYLLDYKS